LQAIFRIFSYLKTKTNARLVVLDPTYADINYASLSSHRRTGMSSMGTQRSTCQQMPHLREANQSRSGTPGIFSISETFKRHKRQTATGREKCTQLIKKPLLGVIADIHDPAVGILLMFKMRFIENDPIAKKWSYFVFLCLVCPVCLLCLTRVYPICLICLLYSTSSTLSTSVVFKTQ
jgi:hypothetical protein